MKKKYWFAPKRFGYGLTPISWEGWLATLIFIGIIVGIGHSLGLYEVVVSDNRIYLFIGAIAAVSILFLLWAKEHTDGKLKWRWEKK